MDAMSGLAYTHLPSNVDEILARVAGVKKIGESKWQFCCPCHSDSDPSATATISDDKILIGCFGCGANADRIMSALGLPMSLLFESEMPVMACSTQSMASYTAIPESVLTKCEWKNAKWGTMDAVMFPYRTKGNAISGTRYRISTSGKDKYRWGSGVNAKEQLYMAQLANKRRDYAILVEGETDTITLRMNGYNAFGVPGANMLSEHTINMLKHCDAVYVWHEDEASTPMVEYARRHLGNKAKVIEASKSGTKTDANGIWKASPDKTVYKTVVDAMISSASKVIDSEDLDITFIEDMAPELTRPIVSSFVYEGKMTLIAGAPGTGKTTFMTYMAHCIANGNPFLGSVVVPKRICWIDRDDPIERLVEHKFNELGAINNKMICRPNRLATVDINEESYDMWVDMIRRANIGILVLDTLRQAVGVSAMNSRISEGQFAQQRIELLRRLCNETGVAVVGITHTNKASGVQAGPTGVNAVYGATEWSAGVDAVYVLTHVQDDSEMVNLSCAKNRLSDSHWYMLLRKSRQRFEYDGTGSKHLGPEELIVGMLKQSNGPMHAEKITDMCVRVMSNTTFRHTLGYLVEVGIVTASPTDSGAIYYSLGA